ncbi:hypothetical protein FHS07_001939 [Microbacterium proteolyticum]|uniref:Uncharacterized protein n=1 Tax=Microbacterium proteolyticum TaxID=1572644 RepID=A0A7W5GG51_9MICO|nr:hypothetical protein [Microbacterium proteolyticum]MBB3158243.1 hypothetical protein [Microbacterium proteolyticum]
MTDEALPADSIDEIRARRGQPDQTDPIEQIRTTRGQREETDIDRLRSARRDRRGTNWKETR